MQISADQAIVRIAGHPKFKIALGLPAAKVQELITKALQLAPDGALAGPTQRAALPQALLPPPPPPLG